MWPHSILGVGSDQVLPHQLAIWNHEDTHFKFQKHGSDAKVMRKFSEDSFFLNNHIGPPKCVNKVFK